MKRVLALVEGQTEERFVKDILCPYFWDRGIDITPKLATTKRVKRGPHFKGGVTDYQKVENDVLRLLGDTGASAVTTFMDYYALPLSFPGMNSRPPSGPLARATHVGGNWAAKIANPRFRPYLMVHEFEALLFSKPEELATALHQPESVRNNLVNIRSAFQTPEDIDDGPQTAPSKRIMRCCPSYQRTLHGPMVTNRIGLNEMRGQCAHFNAWLDWMESL